MAADDLALQEVRALAPMVLTKFSYMESSPEGLVGQGPISLTIFPSQFKFDGKFIYL